jgi:predicted site-specific integrase-resolvase
MEAKLTLQLMTEREVARWLSIKPKTLSNWRAAGRGPRWLRAGGCVRYDSRDVENWLAGCRRTNTREEPIPLPQRAQRAGGR